MISKGLYALITKAKRNKQDSKGLKASLINTLYDMYADFDFIGGISDSIPIIFIAFAFLTANPFKLLPVLALALYAFAIIDKYRIIKCCNLFSSKSANYMLKAFRVYRWITLLIVFAGYAVFNKYCQLNGVKY